MPILRLAYTTLFLIALIAIFVLWAQVGGQSHLDLLPWFVKLGLGVAAAWSIVRATAAAVAGERGWNGQSVRWLGVTLALHVPVRDGDVLRAHVPGRRRTTRPAAGHDGFADWAANRRDDRREAGLSDHRVSESVWRERVRDLLVAGAIAGGQFVVGIFGGGNFHAAAGGRPSLADRGFDADGWRRWRRRSRPMRGRPA